MSDHEKDSKSLDQSISSDQETRENLRFRAKLIDSIPNPVFYKDSDGVYQDCNTAFAEDVLGLPRDEVLGKTVYDMPEAIPPELADVYHEADMKLIRNPGTQTYEAQVRYADGVLRDVVFNKATLSDGDDEVVGMIGVMLDITQQRRAVAQEQYALKIQTASEIAEQVSTILEPRALLEAVIPLIKERFNLYYVHVYTVDAEAGVLRLAAGCGDVGHKMLAEGHAIPLDAKQSLVARAARTKKPVVVDNVTDAPDFMPNPLLPDTQTEAAIPAIAGGEVLGVFDVQHDEAEYFQESDLAIFTTLASQIANVFQNAQLFEQQTQTQESLLEAEMRQRAILESTPIGLAINRMPDGTVLYVNPEFSEILGYKEEDILHKAVPDFYYYEEDSKKAFDLLQAQGGILEDHEVYAKRADGTPLWLSLSIKPIIYGEQHAALSAFVDITERKQAEAALQENERRLSDALHVADIGYWDFDVEAQKFIFNDQYYRVFHHTTAEEVGGYEMSAQEFAQRFVPPEDAPAVAQNIQQALETSDPDFQLQTESRNLTIDGEVIWVSIWLTIEKDEDGRTVKLHGVNQDITARKQAEAERERFTTRLETAAAISEQVGAILDPDELLETVIPLIKERFDLYYVHVYTLDEETDILNLAAGYGEAGEKMLAEGHGIPFEAERSLVARAARTKEAILVDDVTEDPDFLPNPLLPDTKTEVAVPAMAGGEVLGVFDVQHDEPHYFTQADLDVFQTLAAQIANALRSAAALEQTRTRLRVSEALADAQTEAQVLDALMEQASLYPDAQVALMLVDRNTDELTMEIARTDAYESGLPTVPRGTRFTKQTLPALHYLNATDDFVIHDVEADERMDPQSREFMAEMGIHSGANIPLALGDTWLGELVINAREKNFFDKQKLNLYHTLAEQGVAALRLARLNQTTRESERRYSALLSNLRDGFAMVNLDGYVTNCNAAFEQLVGYTLEELKEIKFQELTAEEYREKEAQILQEQALTRGYTDLYEKEYVHKDGHRIPAELTVYVIEDQEGQPAGFWGFIRDITERKEAEMALRESRERFQLVADYTYDWEYWVSPAGEFIYNSPASETITGYTREAFMENPQLLVDIAHPDDRDMVEKLMGEWLTSKEPLELDFRVITKAGEERWIGHASQPVYDQEGAFLGRRASNRDATEAKRAQAALHENQQLLNTFLNNFPDLAFAKDKDGTIILSNHVLEQSFPTPDGQLIGKTVYDLVPDEVADGIWATEQEVLESGEVHEIQEVVPQGDELRTKLTTKFPLYDSEGNVQGLGGVSVDITERIKAEQERERFTTRLETAAAISEQVGAILDPDELLETVIPLIKERFGLYHVHVYTVDKTAGQLNLAAGYGEAGEKMLAEGHSISLDAERSLVARAARTKGSILVDDVTEDPDFLPNPLLPDTKTEVAVPAIAGGEVLGVFDVQHDETYTFSEADLDVFLTLAGQIANAFQSAALFETAEEERDSAQRYLDLAGSVIVALDTQGDVTLINQAGCQVLGYTEEEILGQNWFNLVVPPELRDEGKARFPKLIAGEVEPSAAYTAEVLTKSGARRVLNWHDRVLQDDAGNITGTLSSGEDITERLQAEEQIKVFQTLTETSTDGILMTDIATQQITYANEAAHQLFGGDYEDREMVGKDGRLFWAEEELARLPQVLEQAITESWQGDVVQRRLDGSNFDANATVFTLRDAEGKPSNLVVMVRDITERRKREMFLEDQSQTLAELSSSEDVFGADLQMAYEKITEAAAQTLDVKRSSIWLYDASNTKITCVDLYTEGEGHTQGLELSEEDFPGYFEALRKERVIAAHNAHTHPSTEEFSAEYLTPLGINSMLDTPIRLAGKMIGVVCQEHVGPPREWTWEEQNFSSSIADFVTSAMENQERRRFASQLSTASEIATQINQILDPDELLREVVNLLKERFGLYHAHVYTFDGDDDLLKLRFGYGRPGKIMLRQGHTIPLNRERSLVAQAARTRQSMLVNDVTVDPNFMPNALLPDTKAELAVPLVAGNQVLGVFDVQADEAAHFADVDVDVFETLSGQIATALENAELFERQEEAEAAMRESAEKIRAVFDAISDGIGVSNMMGEITDVNEGLLNLYGYDTREDVIGRNTMDLIAREDWSAATEGINQTLTEGRSPRQEISLVRAEGKEFIGEIGASLLYDEEGEPSGIISVIRDITERKEAERALEMTRSSVEASSDAFYWFDADTKFIDVNQGTLDLLGYTKEELLQLKVFDIDPEFPREAWPGLKVQIKKEGAVAFEGVNQTKDGKQIPVNVVVSYLPFEDQEVYFSIARDISAQKEAQAELERLGLAIRQTADGVAIADLDSNIQFVNQAWAEMHGYRVEEILGGNLAIFHSQEQLEQEVLPFNEEVRAKGYKEGEVGHMRKDGSTFLTRMTVAIIENDVGAPIGLVATTRDITERKRTEARHSTLIESMQDGVFIIQDGRMQFVNEAFASIVGYAVEDIEGMPFTEFIAPEDLPKVAESYRKRQAGEPVPSSYEWRMLHRDGHYVWVSMTVGVVEIGDQVASMGTIKDVTERIEAEQERERFTVQLGTAAEIAHRASAILDPDELLSETVNLLCERFELYHTHVYTLEGDMLQIRAGYGKAGQVMIDEEHSIPLAQDQSLVARAARSREIIVADDVTEEPGFMPNPLLPETKAEIAVPLVIGDEVLGVFDAQAREVGRFTERDIDVFRTLAGQLATAVQNAVYVEELQRTTNRLREVDRLKSEFLANMSHELRTPLNSIIGYAEIMMMGIDGEMDAETLEDVRAIYENGQHLLAMINDILDLAKIEAGRLTLKFEDNVDLAQILEEVETSNASLFANKPVEFRLIIRDELPKIRADRLRLHQIFNNLVSNAQKFTSKGYVEVRAYPQGSHWVCVTVEDTGIGIEQKDIHEIFERFQQVDGSSTRSADGTGLGLAITRELAQMHGGRIEVESKVGEGSEFTVWLPIEE